MELIIIGILVVVGAWWLNRGPSRAAPQQQATLAEVLPARFIVADLETTGLDARRHHIIEIGAIRVNRDSDHHETFRALVKAPGKLTKRITEITGITQAMLDAEGVALEEAMRDFRDFVGDLRMVFYNADFDTAFLKRGSEICGVQIKNEVSCALKMARRAWPGRESYRLKDFNLHEPAGNDVMAVHRALGDCRAAMTVYCAAALKLRSIL